jgi:hypothetical protein
VDCLLTYTISLEVKKNEMKSSSERSKLVRVLTKKNCSCTAGKIWFKTISIQKFISAVFSLQVPAVTA